MTTDPATVFSVGAAVVTGENTDYTVAVSHTNGDGLTCVELYGEGKESVGLAILPTDWWLAALQNTTTAKRWAQAVVNGVLGEALNSGDGVYRP